MLRRHYGSNHSWPHLLKSLRKREHDAIPDFLPHWLVLNNHKPRIKGKKSSHCSLSTPGTRAAAAPHRPPWSDGWSRTAAAPSPASSPPSTSTQSLPVPLTKAPPLAVAPASPRILRSPKPSPTSRNFRNQAKWKLHRSPAARTSRRFSRIPAREGEMPGSNETAGDASPHLGRRVDGDGKLLGNQGGREDGGAWWCHLGIPRRRACSLRRVEKFQSEETVVVSLLQTNPLALF